MTLPLDPRTAERLAKLCGLFGSEHVGERAAAAAKADKLVRAQGLTWSQVIRPTTWSTSTIRQRIDFALGNIELLTEWEVGFLRPIRSRRRLSEKQRGVLEDIVAKIAGGQL
jgi:hypothetical protein